MSALSPRLFFFPISIIANCIQNTFSLLVSVYQNADDKIASKYNFV